MFFMKAPSIQNDWKRLQACLNTNFMKSPLIQNQQKNICSFHEGPVWIWMRRNFGHVWILIYINFMKSPMIQNRQKSLHILHEGPVYPESCEETWGMYEYQFHEVPIDPKSAKEPSCVSWIPCTSKIMGRDFMHVWTIVSWSPQWSKIRRRLQAFIYL